MNDPVDAAEGEAESDPAREAVVVVHPGVLALENPSQSRLSPSIAANSKAIAQRPDEILPVWTTPIVEEETLDTLANNRSGSLVDADDKTEDDTDLPSLDQILENTLENFLK